MKPWHYSRIKIPALYPWERETPYQAPAGNWVFFWLHYRHDATKTPFRESYVPLHTLGLDGVE
ncbi:hypothetical protein [Ensifer aridi]|uniref:hypothetical protein n=1 Tax=Ensifer aridi TaxID=1708715 RepID=UPI000A1080DB|nr:hypothetical protein [Ensifer aridi]